MRVVLFGATGMIGSGVLIECLRDPAVTSVLSIQRKPGDRTDPKLTELIRDDFFHYDDIEDSLRGVDACFFCLGVSAVGMSEEDYRRITLDLTMAAADALIASSPDVVFCYVSGAGTDSSEKGRQMWARVKGATENRLLSLPIRSYMFRPGYIQPVGGVRSATRLYRILYALVGPLYPLLKRLFPRHVITSEDLARAMLRVVRADHPKRILEAPDIAELAAASPSPDPTMR